MLTVTEIVKASRGELLRGIPSGRVTGVSSDTRNVKRGDLFIAIRGDNFDGHDFTAKAVANGAAAVLVSRADIESPADTAVILVKDTVKSLGYIACYHRSKFRMPVIAITGSAGKTTTKELIAAVLGKKYRVLYNKGTENNHIGVPMTLLQLDKRHQAAVIEAGTNHFGEIDWLGAIIRPTTVVFTNIGQSHLAGLQSPAGVFKEKAALIDHVAKNGTIILNGDDGYLRNILKRKLTQKVIVYGVEKKADIKAESVEASGRGFKVVLAKGRSFQLPAPVWGNVFNALAAMACGQLLKVPFNDIASVLRRARPAKGRQCFHSIKGVTLIDDTYNANVVSYTNAIRTLALARGKRQGRLFLVAADMLELGDQSESLHGEIGVMAARAGIDRIYTIGRWAGSVGEKAKETVPSTWINHYEKQDEILRDLNQVLQADDVVLIKGSRGMKMDKLVEQLLKD